MCEKPSLAGVWVSGVVMVLMLDATAPTFSSVTTCAHLCPVPMVTTLPRIAPAAEHQAEHRQASLTLGLWNILTFHDIHFPNILFHI